MLCRFHSVRPEYHRQGIGRQLVNMIKEKYRDCLRIVLVAENDKIGFYESRGFKKRPNPPRCLSPSFGCDGA